MSQPKPASGPFTADFTYAEAVLADFETLYAQKREMTLPMRLALGLPGAAGAVYFGWMLYREGLQLTRVGYALICSVLLVLALSGGSRRPDGSTEKYRRYYLGKQAQFRIDEEGVMFQLEGQQHPARSKFKEIYALYDTDRCFYFVIKGKAYYILPKDSVAGGSPEELAKYMEKKCMKRFVHYDLKGA